jgi:hypothetical protein
MSEIYFGKNITTSSGSGMFSNAFRGDFKNNLTSVYSLPTGLTNISNLFNGCKKLKDMRYNLEDTLIDINSAFDNCSNLSRDFNIPTSINTAHKAFSGTNIKTVKFKKPSAEKSENLIDLSYCFSNCENLNNVTGNIPSTTRNLYSTFENCSSLGEYLSDITVDVVNNTFSGCSNLRSIGNITAKEGSNTFRNCSNLQTVSFFVDNADNSFIGCSRLNTVNIESTNISNIFSHYDNLYSINIKNKSEEKINLFINFSDLAKLNKNACLNISADSDVFSIIDELSIRSVLSDQNRAYYQSNFFKKDDYDCVSDQDFNIFTNYKLKNTLSGGIITLDNRIRKDVHNSNTERNVFYNDFCFEGGTNIKCIYSCTQGNNLNLGNNCFKDSKITDVVFSSYVPKSKYVFDSCYDLVNVRFGQSENNIPDGLFNNCYNLNNVYNHSLSPYVCYNIGTNSFANCSNLKYMRFSDMDGCWINDYGLYEVGISNLQLGTYTERLGYNSIYSSKDRDTVNVYGNLDISNALGISLGGDARINNFYIINRFEGFSNFNFNNVYLLSCNNSLCIEGINNTCINNLIVDTTDSVNIRGRKQSSGGTFYNTIINNFITLGSNSFNFSFDKPSSLNYACISDTIIKNMSYPILLSILDTGTNYIFKNTYITVPPTYIGAGYNVLNIYPQTSLNPNYGTFYINSTDPNVIYTGRNYCISDAKYVWSSNSKAISFIETDNYSFNMYYVNRVFESQEVWDDRTKLGKNNYFIAPNVSFRANSLYVSNSSSPLKFVYVHDAYFYDYAFGKQTNNSSAGDFYYNKKYGSFDEAKVIYNGKVSSAGGNLYKYYDKEEDEHYCTNLNELTDYLDGNYEAEMPGILRNAYNTYVTLGSIDP